MDHSNIHSQYYQIFLDLQRHDSKEDGEESIRLTHVKENTANQTHIIIPREEDNRLRLLPSKNLTSDMTAHIKSGDIGTYNTNINFQEQERSTITQLGNELF